MQVWSGPVVSGSTTGNLLYDVTVTDTSAENSIFWAGLSAGTPNAITVNDPGFNATDGTIIDFIPLYTNTGATTLCTLGGACVPSGPSTYPIVKDTTVGAVALTGNEIVANSPSNIVQVVFSATQQNFHILNLVNATTSPTITTTFPQPQGYLNLVGLAAGGPVQGSSDVTGAITLYYSPFVGNQVPIWNGVSFSVVQFSELQIALSSSAQSSNIIYDVCIFNNAGTAIGVIGPAWASSTAGSGSRGTGAGTPQLIQQNGIWVNAVNISANNGATVYAVPALQCTYVGSILVDSTAGQVSAYRTTGQSRKFGVWNAYNQVPIVLQVVDGGSGWSTNGTSGTGCFASNCNDNLTTLVGLPTQFVNVEYSQSINIHQLSIGAWSGGASAGIGVNSTSGFSGLIANFYYGYGNGTYSENAVTPPMPAKFVQAPSLGANTFYALNNVNIASNTTTTFSGTVMLLKAQWGG